MRVDPHGEAVVNRESVALRLAGMLAPKSPAEVFHLCSCVVDVNPKYVKYAPIAIEDAMKK